MAEESQQMFRMITGYWVTQIVGAVAELGLIDNMPATASELASKVSIEEQTLVRFLRACATVGVAREENGKWSSTPLGDTLRTNAPGSMRDMAIAQSADGHWLPWGHLRDALRTGQRQTTTQLGMELWDHYAKHPKEGAAFSGAMNALSLLVANELVRLLDVRDVKRVVDVGGSSGTLVAALLDAHPHLSGVLLDLPPVIDRAKPALARFGARIEAVGGDFFQNVPEGDVYVLKHVLHDWSDDLAKSILQNIASSMRSNGRVVVLETIVPEDGKPSLATLMDLNMLVLVPGRERTRNEYADLFASAGLRLDRVVDTHSPFQIIEAIRA